MKMFYFDRAPNYGDALNPWMWPRLLGDRLQPNSPTLFLGIGTILKVGLPQAERYAVLGTGGGYEAFPKTDHRWNFYGVRGPLTAKALGLEPHLSAIDGAYFLRKFSLPEPDAAGPRIGFMPHWQTTLSTPWQSICDRSGLRYLDPSLPVDEVLRQIRGCQGVIAEAMHAAITADALRIPWLPVKLGAQFLDFKWRDWLGSIEVDATPVALPAVRPLYCERVHESAFRRSCRELINPVANHFQIRALTAHLRRLRKDFEANPQLGHVSTDRALNAGMDRLQRGLDRLLTCEN